MQPFIRTLLFSTLLSLPVAASAAEQAPTLGQVLASSGITATGFIDTTYSAISGSGKYVGGSLNNRVFDTQRNGFLLNSANVTVFKLPSEGVGGLVNLTLGSDADTIASYGTIDQSKGPANGANQFFDVTEAYLNYATGPATIIAGKFNTLAGAEVIKGPSNSNISRSILFGYAVPFTHTGVRSTYKVNDQLSLIAGINNGWDDVKDTNQQKTIELGASYTPLKTFTLTVQGYSGKEQLTNYPLSSTGGLRNLVDIVATYNATDKLTFIVNGDYGTQENANLPDGTVGTAIWQGVAAYANYQFTDQWRTSLRGEYFDDKDGYRTVVAAGETKGQKQKEATLTVGYSPVKNAELRGEVRHDFSDQTVFLETNIAVLSPAGKAGILNPGEHGFSEILYALASAGNNNGSAFAGLTANTPFYNSLLGIAMFFGRFWIMIPVLAIAGSLASKNTVPHSAGTLPTHTPLFIGILIGVVVLVGVLTFIPALALGPMVEHLHQF